MRRLLLLLSLKPGVLCLDKTWGFGVVKKADGFYARVEIDFERKPQHALSLAYAAEVLQLLTEDHLLARLHREPDAMRELAKTSPAEIVRIVLRSYGPVTVAQLQSTLVPRLIAEAGYPEGRDPATGRRLKLTLELGSADNPEARQAAELMASFMERIGVVLEPSYNNWPAFLKKIERRQAQLFTLTWIGDYPDAQNFLQLFAGENASPGPNRANYRSEAFDRLYREMVARPDSPEREALCRAAAAVVLEDCPWILMAHPMAFSVRHARLRNHRRHDFSWGMEKYWRVGE